MCAIKNSTSAYMGTLRMCMVKRDAENVEVVEKITEESTGKKWGHDKHME